MGEIMNIKFSEVGNGSLSPSLKSSLYNKTFDIWKNFCYRIYGKENLNSENFHFSSSAFWADEQLVEFKTTFDALLASDGFQGVQKEILVREFYKSLLGERNRARIFEKREIEQEPILQSHTKVSSDILSYETEVTIIGSGFGGISVAYELQKASIDYLIVDKQESPGGCWAGSSYSGSRVDVASALYSLSEGGVNNFEFIYENQEEVLRTINAFCHHHLIRENIISGRTVVLAEQNGSRHWKIMLDNGVFINSKFVVFATGQLSTPKFPDIQWGTKQCSIHTGEWSKADDPLGEAKSVCVVGGAASAIQLAVELAKRVESLTIISPHYNWFYNVPHYRNRTDVGLRHLLRNVNFFQSIFRVTAFIDQDIGGLYNVSFGQNGAPGNVNSFRDQCKAVLKKWGIEDFTPDYMPGEKRILVDDGSWAKTIRRENVTFIKDRVCAVDGGIVKTENGITSQFEKIFFATGFETDSFVGGVKVKNFQKQYLNEYWGDRPSAFVGIVVPEFDNLFIMYGPNTNGVVNGHALWFLELQAEVITKYISKSDTSFGWWEDDMKAKLQKFIELVDRGNSMRTWGQGKADSWYRYKNNISVQNWPFSLSTYYQSIYYFDQFEENHLV